MREIKFRAWDREEKEMLYSDPELSADFNIFTGWWNDDTDKERIILMQYTGLKDKNDKKIYEGDILEIDEMKTNRRYGIDIPYIFYLWFEMGLEGEERLEIIGNIYENPELIK